MSRNGLHLGKSLNGLHLGKSLSGLHLGKSLNRFQFGKCCNPKSNLDGMVIFGPIVFGCGLIEAKNWAV